MAGPTTTVFRKEVIDNLRDRRTLAAALLYPLLGPAMILLIIYTVGSNAVQVEEETLTLPVVGGQHAPELLTFLEQQGVEISEAPDDPEQAVREGDLDAVLMIPEGFAERFSQGRPARVQLVNDRSRQSARTAVRRTERLLEAYSGQIGSLRLVLRGIDPRVVEALSIEDRDISTPQSQAAQFLSMAPYFIIFALFVGGMYLAIDSTAGERERGSLEPLLINPVSRSRLVYGKMLATLLFTALAVGETLVGFAVVLNYFPVEEYVGVQMSLAPLAVGTIFLITNPDDASCGRTSAARCQLDSQFQGSAELHYAPDLRARRFPALILAMVPVKMTTTMALDPDAGPATAD